MSQIKRYLASIGARGGRKSRRALEPDTARAMVLVREARRAFRRYRTRCFWSYRPDLEIGTADVAWVAEQLRKHGDRLLTAAEDALRKRTAASAQAKTATGAADRAFKKLTKSMSANLRYAEVQARKDPILLGVVSWGPRRPKRTPRAPGQVMGLRIVRELEDAIALTWKKPVDGGRPAGYRVQRRTPGSPWKDLAMAMVTEIELERQERGVELEYRVVAFNKVGSGGPSGTVMAVL